MKILKKISVLSVFYTLLLLLPGIGFAQKGASPKASPKASQNAQKGAPQGPQFGVQLYSFRNQMEKDVPGTLKKVREMGFRYVETAGFYGMEVAEFKKLLDQNGLKATGTSADWEDLLDSAKLQKVIRNAKILGAPTVVCFWIPHKGNDFTIEDTKKAVEVFGKAGKVLADNKLSFLYHAHGFEFRPHGDGFLFDYLVQNTDARHVNFEMDIYWIKNPDQDPVFWLKKYPTRWKAMHLKDKEKGRPGNQNGQTDVEWNVTLGAGDQDMPAVMRQARKNNIRYYYIEDESSRSLDQAPKSLGYLKSLARGNKGGKS
jgi:sugar phosphate isomerase/epimerase